MKVSKLERREAKSLFQATLVNGRLDEGRVRSAFQQLVEKKPRGYVGIMTHLERLVRLEVAKRTATVESAVPLTPEMQQGALSKLEATYGGGLTLNFVVNPALIGGLRIKVGSDVFDGTVRGRLESLQEAA